MSTCARPGCDTRVEDWQLACRTDWFDLPKGLRDEIWRTYRSTDGVAHARAVREAITLWTQTTTGEEPTPEPRCQHCRAPADFTDPDNGRGVCLVCAKAGMSGSVLLQPCVRCDADVEVLISLTHKAPDLCLDCAIDMLEAVEALSEVPV